MAVQFAVITDQENNIFQLIPCSGMYTSKTYAIYEALTNHLVV